MAVRRFLIPLATAGLLLALSATPAAAKFKHCASSSGTTLAQSVGYRVFQRVTETPKAFYTQHVRVYACGTSGGAGSQKPRRIADFKNNLDDTQRVLQVSINGSWTALSVEDETGVADTDYVIGAHIRNGSTQRLNEPDDVAISDLAVSARGAVLYTTNSSLIAWDAAGRHVLSAGGFSDPAIGNHVAYWTESGTTHAFALSGRATAAH